MYTYCTQCTHMVHTEEHRRMHFGFGAPKLTELAGESLKGHEKKFLQWENSRMISSVIFYLALVD